jgi:hypothetical protein
LTEFAVLLGLCIYLPDDDLVEVETCRRDISDKLLFIIDCAVCWIKYCIILKSIEFGHGALSPRKKFFRSPNKIFRSQISNKGKGKGLHRTGHEGPEGK